MAPGRFQPLQDAQAAVVGERAKGCLYRHIANLLINEVMSSQRLTEAPMTIDSTVIVSTYEKIRPHIRRTPVVTTDGAAFGLAPMPLTFKLELMQHAGSFKTRGAFA